MKALVMSREKVKEKVNKNDDLSADDFIEDSDSPYLRIIQEKFDQKIKGQFKNENKNILIGLDSIRGTEDIIFHFLRYIYSQ